jgi:hypothetical protein
MKGLLFHISATYMTIAFTPRPWKQVFVAINVLCFAFRALILWMRAPE